MSVVDASSPIVESVLNVWTCSSLEGQDGRRRLIYSMQKCTVQSIKSAKLR